MESITSRQERVIGPLAQKKLSKARIAIAGIGGIGSILAGFYARSGVKNILLIDRDLVEISNLSRQMLYTSRDLGKPKAEAARIRLKEVDSKIECSSVVCDLNHKNIEKLLGKCDIIFDCTDNLYTRFLLNDFCKKKRIPWIHSSAIGKRGNVMAILPTQPCFRCTFREAIGLGSCESEGVLVSTTAAIASFQFQLGLNIMIEENEKEQYLFSLDLSKNSIEKIKTRKNPACSACNGSYEYLDGGKEAVSLSKDCENLHQFLLEKKEIGDIIKKIGKLKGSKKGKGYVFWKNLSVFGDGRILIKARSLSEAKTLLAKYVGV